MSEEIFSHKETRPNGDIIECRIWKVPISKHNPDGLDYSCVFIRGGKRLIGYDNSEGHESKGTTHHKHVKDRILSYEFEDIWKLIEDFDKDVEKIENGLIQ